MDDLCARADGWNAYAPSARRVRAAVRDAAAVLALDSLPLPAEARTALGYAFDNACRRSADDPTAALGQFETLALVARTCHDLTALPAAEQKQAFAALAGVIASDGAASERTARACTAAGRALRLLHAAPDPADERTLVRQTRPAWRALLRRLDRVHRQTAAAVPDLIAAPDSQQDPSTLSLLARHRGALDDLALVRAASDAFTRDLDGSPASEPTSQPAVADVWNTVARRVLELGQALGTQGEDDDAAQALRFTCSRIVRYTSVPGEHELRAVLASQRTGTPWERLTAGRHADLLAALEHARRLWVVDLGSNPAADSPLLETLAQICATAYDLAALLDAADRAQATGRPPGAIQSWPGFECDPRSWAARADEAPPILARAVEAALAGRDLQAAEVLDTLTTDHADTLLLARLERAAIARGLARPAPTDPAAQLAAGAPPPDAFLADLRTAIADVCRYTDASVAQPDSDAARQARTFATTISRRLLDSPENFR